MYVSMTFQLQLDDSEAVTQDAGKTKGMDDKTLCNESSAHAEVGPLVRTRKRV